MATVRSQSDGANAFPFRIAPSPPYQNHSGPTVDATITHMVGAGACVIDYDMDGVADLFLPDRRLEADGRSGSRLLRGRGDGTFDDVTLSAAIDDGGWSVGCAVADLENDGDPDLFVTRLGANAMWRNQGDGTFRADAAFSDRHAWSTSAAFSDLDLDGLVDLYVCNYIDLDGVDLAARCPYYGIEVFCGPNGLPGARDVLYRNEQGARLRDVTREAGVDASERRGFSVLPVDLDGDRLPELHVANDAGMNLLFRNLGGFGFEDASLLSGVGYSGVGMEQSGMGSTAGDYDGDGDEDIYVTNFQRDYNTLYRNDGELAFVDVTHRAELALPTLGYLGWGAHFLDVGNDGALDLFVANGHIYSELEDRDEVGEPYRQRVQLFRGDGAGGFREAPAASGSRPRLGRGTAVADLNDDGALDVIVNNLGASPDLYLGSESGSSWIRLRLIGTSSNRDGWNTVVVALGVVADTDTSAGVVRRELRSSDGFLGTNEAVLHLGFGDARVVPEISIAWPGGTVDRCRDLPTRATYVAKEGLGCLR